MDQHFLKSAFREKLIEHLLIGELLKISWARGDCSLEVAKPEVDNQGYDVLAEDKTFASKNEEPDKWAPGVRHHGS
ncbi:hypothetical protein [Lamprocystis purpurea]|jgi:hypothetical protein|uniref:hypothetical protein n=1 Tax=Lamprocystis purpurea TaxID=61598 RepID=UPI00035CBCB3|nr:hypothetical protein [Lamprocystis purpurea]